MNGIQDHRRWRLTYYGIKQKQDALENDGRPDEVKCIHIGKLIRYH